MSSDGWIEIRKRARRANHADAEAQEPVLMADPFPVTVEDLGHLFVLVMWFTALSAFSVLTSLHYLREYPLFFMILAILYAQLGIATVVDGKTGVQHQIFDCPKDNPELISPAKDAAFNTMLESSKLFQKISGPILFLGFLIKAFLADDKLMWNAIHADVFGRYVHSFELLQYLDCDWFKTLRHCCARPDRYMPYFSLGDLYRYLGREWMKTFATCWAIYHLSKFAIVWASILYAKGTRGAIQQVKDCYGLLSRMPLDFKLIKERCTATCAHTRKG